jgi:hypothetical protein
MAKRAPARRRPRKAKPGTKGLEPTQCRLEQSEGSAAEAAEAVEKAGGCVVGQYKEPLGGHPTLLSILPIDKIEPTPFQRDLSDAHHKRLADSRTQIWRELPNSNDLVKRGAEPLRRPLVFAVGLQLPWRLQPASFGDLARSLQ